jgi:DNA-directed RNA polymerase specialized sigma24 family protein
MSDLITQLYNSKDISDCIGFHFDPDCQQDVKQDLFEILLSLKPGTLESKQNLKAYIASIIANMKRQRYGKIAKTVNNYNRFEELPAIANIVDEQDDKEQIFCKVDEKLNWYQRGIFELYAKLGSVRAVSLETSIPAVSIKRTIREGRKLIKKEW